MERTLDDGSNQPLFRANPTRRRIGMLTNSASAFASAAVSGVLLFINGSFVLALTTVLGASEVPLMSKAEFAQTLLFTLPFAMLVIEWMMIDYIRRHVTIGSISSASKPAENRTENRTENRSRTRAVSVDQDTAKP